MRLYAIDSEMFRLNTNADTGNDGKDDCLSVIADCEKNHGRLNAFYLVTLYALLQSWTKRILRFRTRLFHVECGRNHPRPTKCPTNWQRSVCKTEYLLLL